MARKGFTLIELLIVVGILAILSTVSVLVLNPIQKLQESRDIQRISDLSTVRDAVVLYLARSNDASPGLGGTSGTACPVGGLTNSWRSSNANQVIEGQPFRTPDTAVVSPSPTIAVDGNGWVTVAFTSISGGVPFSRLPQDPAYTAAAAGNGLDGTAHYYAYQCSALTFELNANLESQKYAAKESSDGGTSGCSGTGTAVLRCSSGKADLIYEIGNDPGLDL